MLHIEWFCIYENTYPTATSEENTKRRYENCTKNFNETAHSSSFVIFVYISSSYDCFVANKQENRNIWIRLIREETEFECVTSSV